MIRAQSLILYLAVFMHASLNADYTEFFEGLVEVREGLYEGNVLVAPNRSTETWLVDHNGTPKQIWKSQETPGLAAYLDSSGRLIRSCRIDPELDSPFNGAGGAGGGLEIYSAEGDLLWRYELADNRSQLHHDFDVLSNGNILAIAWGAATKDEAIAAGREETGIFGNWLLYAKLVEIEPSYPDGGRIVWSWSAWDYLTQDRDSSLPNFGKPSENPHLIDINYYRAPKVVRKHPLPSKGAKIGEVDWMHANSVDLNESTGLIALSIHGFDEVLIIDRNAPEKGIVYRYGNPRTYGHADGERQLLFRQHDASWIDPGLPGEGNLLVFSNGLPEKGKDFSVVQELDLPFKNSLSPTGAFRLPRLVWFWSGEPGAPFSFFANRMSGAQRLPNGATLIVHGPKGRIFQVDRTGQIVWDYWSPYGKYGPESSNPRHASSVRPIFKARAYPASIGISRLGTEMEFEDSGVDRMPELRNFFEKASLSDITRERLIEGKSQAQLDFEAAIRSNETSKALQALDEMVKEKGKAARLRALLSVMPSRAMRGARADLERVANQVLEEQSQGSSEEFYLKGVLYHDWLGKRERGLSLLRESLIQGGWRHDELGSLESLQNALVRLEGEKGSISRDLLNAYARILADLKSND